MKRNEFLLRLAVENKFAVVSEQVDVIKLPNISKHAMSQGSLSPDPQSHDALPEFDPSDVHQTLLTQPPTLESTASVIYPDINASLFDTCILPKSNTIDIQETPSTQPHIQKSTTYGVVSREVYVSNFPSTSNSGTCQEISRPNSQNIDDILSDKTTLPDSKPSVSETIVSVESFSECEDLIDSDYISSILSESNFRDTAKTDLEHMTSIPKSNISLESLFVVPDSVNDNDQNKSDTSTAWDRTESERFEDDSHSHDIQYYESSGSEYSPLENSSSSTDSDSSSSTDTDLSSDHETGMGKESSNAYFLPYYSERSQIGKVKRTYPRGNSKLLHFKGKDKSILSDVTNDMEINDQPSSSKNAVELGQKRSFHSETYISSVKIPKLSATYEASTQKSITNSDTNQQYIKRPSARERPTICPICYQDVITHFTRHLFRHHSNNKDVKLIKSLKPGSKERLALVAALRKQGYFHLNTEKDILNPVRTSKDPQTDYFVCTYCLGHYTKKLLYKHVKTCRNKPAEIVNPGRNCLTKSQTFMASMLSKNHEYLRTSRIKKEVFGIMRADNISAVAKNDPLICLYGETLLARHKRQQIASVVSSRIREMARMLIVLKTMNNDIRGFFDALRPETFRTLISAAKLISGYDENVKTFKAPSLALHMGTHLKMLCNVAFKVVIEKRNLPNISWDNRDQKKSEIKDLKKLIEGHWCNEISSLALKTLKERQWEKPVQLPLTSDILAFQTYLNNLSEKVYGQLNNNIEIRTNYKVLTECVLAQTVMFNRKRVGDVQYLKIETYNKDNCRIDQEAFTESLTPVEKILSTKFRRVVTDGKGSKPVPILFPRRIQKFITCLLKIRETTNIVPKSNPYMFANPGSENKWMAGANIIRRLSKNCGAKQPTLLTSTKFRKHIATTLQLMNMKPDEMEQIATFMGHTKKTHAEFYRLPQDIYQTAKVAKVLLLLEKGKGKEFQGKSLNEIELDKDVYYSSESGEDEDLDDTQPLSENRPTIPTTSIFNEMSRNGGVVHNNTHTVDKSSELLEEGEIGEKELTEERLNEEKEAEEEKQIELPKKQSRSKTLSGRIRWTDGEKRIVLEYFRVHLENKVTPKKHECDQFLTKFGNRLINKNWVRVKTLVYNSFRGT